MNVYKTIEKCGLCDSRNLQEYLNFGMSPLANNLKSKPDDYEPTAPLRVLKCKDCDSFQLGERVDPEVLFSNYNYKSPQGLDKHFKEYAEKIVNKLKLEPDDLMIGIGGNNGLLEKHFQSLGLKSINVEPATNIVPDSIANGVETYNNFFDKDVAKTIVSKNGTANIICCNNCFAHTDLHPIVDGVSELLDEHGVFIIENAYWLDTVRNSDIGQIYSEHYFYHSIKPLAKFFESKGFEIFDVERNSIQCGSFRAYIKWKTNKHLYVTDSVNNIIKEEEDSKLYNIETYEKLSGNLLKISNELQSLLLNIPARSKIGLYGVPAKIVLLLQYLDIKHYFNYSTDDAPNKLNKYIPGTHIQIIDKESFFNQNFDYILIGAYNYKDLIINNNRNFSGKWINILPKLEVI